MNQRRLVRSAAVCLSLCALAALAACEDEIIQGPAATGTEATASSSGAKLQVPTAKSSASAFTSASSAPSQTVSVATPSGPLKWSDFGGPVVKPDLDAGAKAWAVVPVSEGWDTLKLSLMPVDRLEGDEAVFKGPTDKRDVFVPGAFVAGAKAADGLVKGDAVAVAAKGSRAFARVTAVEGGKVKVRFRYAGDIQELDVDPIDVMKLDGTLKFGAPASYTTNKEEPGGKSKQEFRPGFFVHNAPAEDKAWLITTSGKPLRVPTSTVKPVSVHVTHKVGDKIWFANGELFVEGQITALEDDGLRYKLKLASGEETSAPFESVSTPVK